ncbi:MAG: hypothetical protein AcusKO_22730 [Acuticoccus sp.]
MKRRTIATLGALFLVVAVMTTDYGADMPQQEPDTMAELLWLPIF